MGLEKAEIRIDVVKSLGRRVDEMAEGSKKQVIMQEGAEQALSIARENVAKLMADIDVDLKDEKFAERVAAPLQAAQYAKDQMKRAVAAIHSMVEGARLNRIRAEGRVSGMEDLLDFLENNVKAERAKLERFNAMLRSGEVTFEDEGVPGAVASITDIEDGRKALEGKPRRAPGVGPGPSVKQQRQAEEAAEQAAAEKAKDTPAPKAEKAKPEKEKAAKPPKKPNGEGSKKPSATKPKRRRAKAKPKAKAKGNGVSTPDAPDAG
jgi:hypothetical protein